MLRHWLGRCPGQEQKLYEYLRTTRDFPAVQAQTVLQLLFGFTPDDLREPETFEVLIEYLRHDRPAIRILAEWHLNRIVPQGKAIPFQPDADAETREKTYLAWKKLIPNGKLPLTTP